MGQDGVYLARVKVIPSRWTCLSPWKDGLSLEMGDNDRDKLLTLAWCCEPNGCAVRIMARLCHAAFSGGRVLIHIDLSTGLMWNKYNATWMTFPLDNFHYLGIYGAAFFFGKITTTVLALSKLPCFRSVFWYICIAFGTSYIQKKDRWHETKYCFLCSLGPIPVICGCPCSWYCLFLGYICKCLLFFLQVCASRLCRTITWLRCTTLVSLRSQYSVAVILSHNLSLYVQLTTLSIYSTYSSNLQRYTVAGLCGVAISASWSFLHS